MNRTPSTLRGKEIFCSQSCSATYNNTIYKKRDRKVNLCINCEFEINKGSVSYCSKKCEYEFKYKKMEKELNWYMNKM